MGRRGWRRREGDEDEEVMEKNEEGERRYELRRRETMRSEGRRGSGERNRRRKMRRREGRSLNQCEDEEEGHKKEKILRRE